MELLYIFIMNSGIGSSIFLYGKLRRFFRLSSKLFCLVFFPVKQSVSSPQGVNKIAVNNLSYFSTRFEVIVNI